MTDLDNQIRIWTASLGAPWEGILRLCLAGAASGLIGIEREVRGRSAGLRTTMLLSVGACLAMLVSINFAARSWPHDTTFAVTTDPARVAYGVMTGIGLLCAGVIVKSGDQVHGMTTAAGLWCATALGISSGFGLYLLTIGAAILMVIILWLLQIGETKLPRIKYVWVTIRRAWSAECVLQTVTSINATGLKIGEVRFERSADNQTVIINLNIGLHTRRRFYELVEKIEKDPSMDLIGGSNL
jgi:putative Mg2+ transporter-C (MgtC) family protein